MAYTKAFLLLEKPPKKKPYKNFVRKPTEINEGNYKKYRNKFDKKLHYENKFYEYKLG